jgi:hypothetical protein
VNLTLFSKILLTSDAGLQREANVISAAVFLVSKGYDNVVVSPQLLILSSTVLTSYIIKGAVGIVLSSI